MNPQSAKEKKTNWIWNLILLFLFFLFFAASGTITCQIDSPHRDECIKEAINDMLPRLGNGMPSLNIPPLDPLMLERTSFKHKRPNLFDVSGEVRKVKVTGGTRAVLKDVKWVLTPKCTNDSFAHVYVCFTLHFRTNITRTDIETVMELYIPSIMAEGLYKTEGRFNNLRIKSKGFFNFTASKRESDFKFNLGGLTLRWFHSIN